MNVTIEHALRLLAEALFRESAERHDIVVTLGPAHVAALRREVAEKSLLMAGSARLDDPADVVVLLGPARVVVRGVAATSERWHHANYKMHFVGVPCGQAGVSAHWTTTDAAAVTCGGCRNTNVFKAAALHRVKCLLHALVDDTK